MNRGRATIGQVVAALALAIAAGLLRWQFVDVQSGDYRSFLARWWAYLDANGLAGLSNESFSNYNTPYLVILGLATLLPVPPLVAVKAISFAGDLLLAGLSARLLSALGCGRWSQVGVFGVVVCWPTVVMNSSVWAQCDSLYASACLACLLALVRGRPWAASAWLGVGLAFKLQAIFMAPVLLAVLLVNGRRWRPLLALPAAFVACLVPAMIAGRSLASQLLVYPLQLANPSGAGPTTGARTAPGSRPGRPGPSQAIDAGGAFTLNDGQSFTHNAPTPYAWLPPDAPVAIKYAGVALVGCLVLAFLAWLVARGRRLSPRQVLFTAAALTLVVPVLLPEMHERYFYLAEVLLVIAAFLDPWWAIPAVGVQAASITTYRSYLLNRSVFPLHAAAVVALLAALAAAVLLWRSLGSGGAASREAAG